MRALYFYVSTQIWRKSNMNLLSKIVSIQFNKSKCYWAELLSIRGNMKYCICTKFIMFFFVCTLNTGIQFCVDSICLRENPFPQIVSNAFYRLVSKAFLCVFLYFVIYMFYSKIFFFFSLRKKSCFNNNNYKTIWLQLWELIICH